MSTMPDHRWLWLARVVRVIDADTIDVELDAGFRAIRSERLRLLGINAPEVVGKDAARGKAATDWVHEWLRVAALGRDSWPLLIETHKGMDSFGRYLAVIWRVVDESCLNVEIVLAGQAVEDVRT